jgi:hypothetical protein
MFKSKTLLIVGAGASQEANLPTGTQLKDIIAKKLDLTFNQSSPSSRGDPEIARELRNYARQTNTDATTYFREAGRIRDAMSQAISIDNFLDAHSTNSGVVICGKLGIVQAILDAEQHSKLFSKAELGRIATFDRDKVYDTWYLPFFQLLHENVRVDDVDTLFDNVSFIIFNYDPCVKHYLYNAIQTYYGIRDRDAQALMGKLIISHPYGVVGRLPWQDSRINVSFGGELRNYNLLDIAGQIRTFTERMAGDDPTLAEIRRQVQEAETMVFLGFAFHELNMQLLSPETGSNVRRVFGTAKGISDTDVKTAVVPEISGMLKKGLNRQTHINNQLTCSALFAEYWLTLSR